MEIDKMKKFLSPTVIKGFMKMVVFELGPERLYIWKNGEERGNWVNS